MRAHNALNEHKTSPVINWAYDFWPVLAVVLVVRSFFYEPFNIPSESMNPTLETGDFILVNKYAFGVRLPLINTKIIDSGEPQHGDVAVFRFPKNPSISFIKRIIGLPGDHIVFQNGELYVNGKIQPHQVGNEVPLPVKYRDQNGQEQTIPVQATQWVVNLGEHRFISQYIKTEQQNPTAQQFLKNYEAGIPLSLQQSWEVTVPQGQYFAMGDNRDQSDDSRFWGFVPEENLTGKAMFIWMHKKPGLNLPSFERNGRIP
ncbi:signal peptidase I [Acinetobacter puyangensis]|uniref:signal peptidase I n=1 Tax=Acinetobacter puyangensis TaxID=1096779 RepID=UPI003916F38D